MPFCAHRCGYCNFTLVARRDDLIQPYLAALDRELSALGEPRQVDTLFLGGGTPTQLRGRQLARLLSIVTSWFSLAPGGEFSVEANPADLDDVCMGLLADAGVTRVSLGAQSFNERKLRVLERDHSREHVVRAFDAARRRVAKVSLDLIFAAPGETEAEWNADLRLALSLEADHVSTYGLTFERGTAFWGRKLRGQLTPADESLERSLFEMSIDALTQAGFEHYEVSNFARPGHRCRHNETYWDAQEYYAAGPGAARYVAGRREVNHRSTTAYLRRVLAGQSPTAEWEELSAEDRAREALVLGLRRLDGVRRGEFAGRFGHTVDALAGDALGRFANEGLLSDDGDRVALSRAGLFVSDAIWPHFLRA